MALNNYINFALFGRSQARTVYVSVEAAESHGSRTH